MGDFPLKFLVQIFRTWCSLVALIAVVVVLPFGAHVWPPSFEEWKKSHEPSDVFFSDRHGDLLQQARVRFDARVMPWVSLQELASAVPKAVVAAEDHRFWLHPGFDVVTLASIAWQSIRKHRWPERGGSTISMQLASLHDLELKKCRSARKAWCKFVQTLMGIGFELRWSKEQVLEAYLNKASFRGELQGIGAASWGLFGKEPRLLTPDEAAILAVLLRGPEAEQDRVSARACAFITAKGQETGNRCSFVKESVYRALTRTPSFNLNLDAAPHLARLWRENYQDTLPHRGRQTHLETTLERSLQNEVAQILLSRVRELEDRNVRDGAALVVDNESGDVLAYVGNVGTLENPESGETAGKGRGTSYVDGIQAARQAGSTLKPFLYGLAIDERLITEVSLLEDRPLAIGGGHGDYRPENYDKHFRGLVDARRALASSLNVPAVRLGLLVGVDAFAKRLQDFGFSGLREGEFYGPSLALGTADVTLWELVEAYRALAVAATSRALLRPQRIFPEEGEGGKPLPISDAAAWIIGDILSDRDARAMTFGLESPIATSFWTAVKTGTSKDMRDNWCLGWSSRYTVGVWVGNFTGDPMRNVSGISGAAPAWADIMAHLHKSEPSQQPTPPDTLVKASWREPSGATKVRTFVRGTEPEQFETLAGSEPSGAAIVAELRILYPTDRMVLAVDPDIPLERQRVFFTGEGVSGQQGYWVLDGKRLQCHWQDCAWIIEAGRHDLVLVDESGNRSQPRTFFVKG